MKFLRPGEVAGQRHGMKSNPLQLSFVVDYDAVGDVYDEDDNEVVRVWIVTGRDQGTILKTMVDDTFTLKRE